MKKIDLKSLKRVINREKLDTFGFVNNVYKKDIVNGDFTVVIELKDDEIITRVVDKEFNDEFTNVDVNTSGEFIGTIKKSYDDVIDTFIKECTSVDLNYTDQVNGVIKYINDKYNDNIEYLWEDTPDSGIFRNKNSKKWYAVVMSVRENRVGGLTDKKIMVIDLKYYKGKTIEIVDNKNIYPGYHMNKNSWITIRLDESVENSVIEKYIDISYSLSEKKNML